MTGDVAIRTNELGKHYTLGIHQRGYGTLRESIVRSAKRVVPAGGSGPRGCHALGSPRSLLVDSSR